MPIAYACACSENMVCAGMCMLVQAQLDASPRKGGPLVKRRLDTSAVSVGIYLGLEARKVADEGRSQFSLCLCFLQLWGRKGGKLGNRDPEEWTPLSHL